MIAQAPPQERPAAARREPPLRLLDNPILVAQARRRLRRKQIVPSVLVTAILGACGVMFALVSSDQRQGFTVLSYACLIYMGAHLHFRGTTQVAAALAEERRSGILDFHRATPTTPFTDGLGYLLGCATREYALCAVALPFLLLSAAQSKLPVLGVLGAAAMLVVTAWFYHGAAMVLGLSVNSRRGMIGSAALLVPLVLGGAFPLYRAGFVTVAYLSPFPVVMRLLGSESEIGASVSFYGLSLHPVLFTLLVQGSILLFLLSGAVRKLRREGAPLFSRAGAAAFFSLLVYLSFGGAWSFVRGERVPSGATGEDMIYVVLSSYLFGSLCVGAWLLVSVAPSYLDFLRALRRALRRGREIDLLEDGAPSWPLSAMLSGLLLLGLLVLRLAFSDRVPAAAVPSKETLLAILGAVSFLCYVGAAADYVRLCQHKAERQNAVLLVFLTMILPWILVGIAASATGDKAYPLYLAALSPGFAAGASALTMAAAWAQKAAPATPGPTTVLSILATTCLAAWFLQKTRTLQQELSRNRPTKG